MRKIVILLFFLVCFAGFNQLSVNSSYAQYCGDMYCSGGSSCMWCGGCTACGGAGCNAGTGLCNLTYTISGNVFIDTDGDGFKDAGESNYASGATVNVWGNINTTDGSGNYSQANLTAGTNNVTLTVPVGYVATTANPRVVTVGPDQVINFGIQPILYTISGNVYIDTDGDGFKDAGEGNYSGATVNVWGVNTSTNALGNYSRGGLTAGTNNVTLTVPVGYVATTTNPRSVTVGPDANSIDFGIQLTPPPACPGEISVLDSTLDPGSSTTASVTSCTGIEDPPTVDWDPPVSTNPECSDGLNNDADGLTDSADPDCHTGGDPTKPYNPTDDDEDPGVDSCNDGGTGTPTNTSTSSTVSYVAPACPTSPLVCPVSIEMSGPGGTTTYNTNITVASTYSITTNIRSVADGSACTSLSGTEYTGSSVGVNVTGGNLPPSGLTQSTSTGSTVFACLPSSDYIVTLSVPSGYTLMDRSGGVDSGVNGISFTGISANQTANFCIAQIDPWFQTDTGDARFNNLNNPIPLNQYGSVHATYPGIFYSSKNTAQLGFGSASTRNWVIDNEYSYNANTENRNGGMSYDFYKAKARQDGVTVTQLDSDTFTQSDLDKSESYVNDNAGVFERNGDLTINNYTHTNGKRVVMLVNGDVTINDASISIPLNQGLLIIAAKNDITFAKTIGQPNPDTAYVTGGAFTFDGFYTAQGDIILD
ncbi:MAG: hypothetical protein Q7T54_02710, partial [Candidatus Levybacteria bacterium]|nr:hypothetical protein [Candidatus Levybacteria bacterium]